MPSRPEADICSLPLVVDSMVKTETPSPPDGERPPRRGPAAWKQAATAVGFVVLLASLVVGTDLLGARAALFGSAAPPPRPSAFGRVFRSTSGAAGGRTVLRSQPWWQEVAGLRGDGATKTRPLTIGADAIQWRLRWSCSGPGRFTVRGGGARPLVDAACPARRTTELATQRRVALDVAAGGPWRMRVERQIDVPLVEPPLAAMTRPGARRLSSGSFYGIDQTGKGRVTIYRLPGGRHALRLEDFFVTPNVDLEIRLSPLRAPHSTRRFRSAPSVLVRALDVTTGALNFTIPAGVDPARYRSVVLWCQNLLSAYAAASLGPAR